MKDFLFKIQIRLNAAIYFIKYLIITFTSYSGVDEQSDVIISLTSFPARFDQLYLNLTSLLLQSKKPKHVILYLGNDCKNNSLPKKILKLKKHGLVIRFVPDNLKGHKKYYYAFQDFPNHLIITVDDDCTYSSLLVENLYSTYMSNPNCVVANLVSRMVISDNQILPYKSWESHTYKYTNARLDLVAIGVGGVLYNPKLFVDDVFNLNMIKNLYINNDDMWLKRNELLSSVPVIWSKIPSLCENFRSSYFLLLSSSKGSLLTQNNISVNYKINTDSTISDIQNICNTYHIKLK